MSPEHDSIPAPRVLSRRPSRLLRRLYKFRYRAWFKDKAFTSDWASTHFASWHHVLRPLRDCPLRILEIGSWEGRSAIFFLNFFPNARIVCIDTFQGTPGEEAFDQSDRSGSVEARFDRNLASFAGRVEKLASDSGPALQRLAAEGRRFDLAYIDGDHKRDKVMADSVATWPLVARGGIVIWDDYTWRTDLPAELRPQPAIDAFLSAHAGSLRLLAKTEQVIVERLRG